MALRTCLRLRYRAYSKAFCWPAPDIIAEAPDCRTAPAAGNSFGSPDLTDSRAAKVLHIDRIRTVRVRHNHRPCDRRDRTRDSAKADGRAHQSTLWTLTGRSCWLCSTFRHPWRYHDALSARFCVAPPTSRVNCGCLSAKSQRNNRPTQRAHGPLSKRAVDRQRASRDRRANPPWAHGNERRTCVAVAAPFGRPPGNTTSGVCSRVPRTDPAQTCFDIGDLADQLWVCAQLLYASRLPGGFLANGYQ
jgi:hypothetical protein